MRFRHTKPLASRAARSPAAPEAGCSRLPHSGRATRKHPGCGLPSAAIFAISVVLLAGCQTPIVHKDYLEFSAAQDPTAAASDIARNVGACWFKGGRGAFAGLSYAPELNSYANHPRVLIVSKAEPHGLPKLVIEATRSSSGSSVKLFGPLMATAEGPAIARDIERWARGGTGC
jgi:hypothetical protein